MAADDAAITWQWQIFPPGVQQNAKLTQAQKDKQSTYCQSNTAMIAGYLQAILQLLLPPWTSWDGRHENRVTITEHFTAETIAALYTYLKLTVGATTADAFRKDMYPTPKWTPSALALIVWVALYKPTQLIQGGTKVLSLPTYMSFSMTPVELSQLKVTVSPVPLLHPITDVMPADSRATFFNAGIPSCRSYAGKIAGRQGMPIVTLDSINRLLATSESNDAWVERVSSGSIQPSASKPAASGSNGLLWIGAAAVAAYFLMRDKT